MAPSIPPRASVSVWALARSQHGVVTRSQLIELGFSDDAVRHRLAKGRIHLLARGVYAVGWPELTQRGRWMAAVLSCGPEAVLSHRSAATLWRFGKEGGRIDVSVPRSSDRQRPGLAIHRRSSLTESERTTHERIPVTTPIATLVDLAAVLGRSELERAISEADKRGLASPVWLRSALDELARRPGLGVLRELLDHQTFRLTDSELERRFLPLAHSAGLPPPQTRRRVNGFRVDFFWPALGLVVETDGLTYHRTPGAQGRDRERDQAHAAAGLTPLRFTHAQVRYEPERVRATLVAVAARLGRSGGRLAA